MVSLNYNESDSDLTHAIEHGITVLNSVREKMF